MFSRKKAVIAAVTVALLLFVTVFLFVALNSWYNSYLTEQEAQNEKQEFDRTVEITKIDGTKLYVNNQFKDDLNLTELKVGGKVCDLSNTSIDMGLAIVDIGLCTYGLAYPAQDVALVTDSGVKNEYELIRGVFGTEFIIVFTTEICDISQGYTRLYGMSAFNNSHVEVPETVSYSYNVCARHFNYTLGNTASGTYASLFNVVGATNSHVWINTTSVYSPVTFTPIVISSNAGTFDVQVASSSPSDNHRCAGALNIDDVYGAHMSDCDATGMSKIWVSLT